MVVPLAAGVAVAWMNGLRLVNWSSVGSCLAGSSAFAPLPVEEATVEVSDRPAGAGLSAPAAPRAVVAPPPWPCTATTEATAIAATTTITSTTLDLLMVIIAHLSPLRRPRRESTGTR